jgi:hypothetical protein
MANNDLVPIRTTLQARIPKTCEYYIKCSELKARASTVEFCEDTINRINSAFERECDLVECMMDMCDFKQSSTACGMYKNLVKTVSRLLTDCTNYPAHTLFCDLIPVNSWLKDDFPEAVPITILLELSHNLNAISDSMYSTVLGMVHESIEALCKKQR